MVGDIFQPTHLLFVLVVALLVLGPKRLPEVGRTLGSGIRDFRQALSGETHDPPRHQDSEQVAATTTELRHQPESVTDDGIVWPEEAVGPTSFDEPVEAATAEPATAVVADPEPTEPATVVVADSNPTEPATVVATDSGPAGTSSTGEANAAPADEAHAPHPGAAHATQVHAAAGGASPVAESSDSTESHTDQS